MLGLDHGLGYSFNPGLTTSGGVAAGATRKAAATTLVTSPTATACFGCHDSKDAEWPDRVNGGAVYGSRSVAGTKRETGLICHGPSFVCAAPGVLSHAGPALAQRDTAQWQCTACPYPKGLSGSVSTGVVVVSEASAKFGHYSG